MEQGKMLSSAAQLTLATNLAAHGDSVQLPQFTRASPKSWFCDANFHVRGVTASETKYWHTVTKLNADTLEKMQEFLEADHGKDPYTSLSVITSAPLWGHATTEARPVSVNHLNGGQRPSAFIHEL